MKPLLHETPYGVCGTFSLPVALAWRIFSKGIAPNEAAEAIDFRGDGELALHFLKALAVMA